MYRWPLIALALGGCANAASTEGSTETPAPAAVDMAPAPMAAPTTEDAKSCQMVVAVTGMT